MSVSLEVSTSEQDNWQVVAATGEIDIATIGKLDEAIGAALDRNDAHVAADLRNVTFMDSTGIRSLIAAHQRAEASDGRLVMLVDEGPVRRILDITGLLDTFEIHSSFDDIKS